MDVVFVESLAIQMKNVNNAIRSKHVVFGLFDPDHFHALLFSPLHMISGKLDSSVVRNK